VIALPILWLAINPREEPGVAKPDEPTVDRIERETLDLIQTHLTVLKYAKVGRDLARLEKLGEAVTAENPPTGFIQLNNAAARARRLDIPVLIAFSKADTFAPEGRPEGLYAPPFPPDSPAEGAPCPSIKPQDADPGALALLHFPVLVRWLEENVRYFKFDFVQSFKDPNRFPDAVSTQFAYTAKVRNPLGIRSSLEFFTAHPWKVLPRPIGSAYQMIRSWSASRWTHQRLLAALGSSRR
jgi:hypothetical protein